MRAVSGNEGDIQSPMGFRQIARFWWARQAQITGSRVKLARCLGHAGLLSNTWAGLDNPLELLFEATQAYE